MMFLPSCKEAAALLIAREDRPLPLKDRVALRIHLAACNACPVFEKQLLILRNSLSNWRNYNQDATN
ncbi:zf-HC2 domain-containing protein [Caenimonas sp. SL110]|uniref:zf-HC2 domain-containing protein n=1 Tax=Caenimonas sp. SL110 TaxID=1450524 RepID=UPI0009E401BE|nr:zf-HC2 domain-containing protein [Caenimonas sp. SL110]